MEERERGFTLIELLVTVSVLMVLMLAGGVWLASMHPGALRGAVDSYDSAIAAARAVASSSGNGATIAFLPRTDPRGNALTGFTLTVYSGRPNSSGSVVPTNLMRTISDAAVSEKTLGSPPFAIFISSAGSSSGEAAYPQLDSQGNANFSPLAQQPPCPPGGLVLTFTGPQGATAARTLNCNVSIAAGALPNPSPTPNVPLLTPAQLIFYWPSAPVQSVVATEWGYTHWFASTTGFACGSGIAAYPSAPQPYQSPPSAAESNASPAPPSGAPYSYPSSAHSMNDAPAPFPVQPESAGACVLSIADEYAQTAAGAVNVMGALTAAPQTVAWSASTDHSERDVVLSKTFDDQVLRPSIVNTNCAGIVKTAWISQSTPASWSDTASVQLGIEPVVESNGNNAGGGCTLTVESQYPNEPTVSIVVNVALPAQVLQTWPEEVELGANGAAIAYAPRVVPGAILAALLNGALGGGVARAGTTAGCMAYALTSEGAPDLAPTEANVLGIYTDANGCFTNGSGGAPTAQSAVVVWEPTGNSATYALKDNTCGTTANIGTWNPASATGVQAALPTSPGALSGTCAIGITDGITITPTLDHGLADIDVMIGMCVSDGTLPVGDSCTFQGVAPGGCAAQGGSNTPGLAISATGPISVSGVEYGEFTITRTGTGTISVTEQPMIEHEIPPPPTNPTGPITCGMGGDGLATVITLN